MKRVGYSDIINSKRKKMEKPRSWITIPKVEQTISDKVRIVNYNILAPSLVDKVQYKCDTKFIAWDYRKPLIFEQLSEFKGDLIFL